MAEELLFFLNSVLQAYSTSGPRARYGPFEFNYDPQDCLQISIAW